MISVLIIPFVLITPFEINMYTPITHKIGIANETVEFEWIFEQKGGIDRHYRIGNIEMYGGDWNFNIDGSTFKVPPDSEVVILILIKIPNNAQIGDAYRIQFSCYDEVEEKEEIKTDWGTSFTLQVDGTNTSKLDITREDAVITAKGQEYQFKPLILIPIMIIIICIYIWIKEY
jgi:hypothetical protein